MRRFSQRRIACTFTTCRDEWARSRPAWWLVRGAWEEAGTLRGQPAKGDAMKRFASLLCAALAILTVAEVASASGPHQYGGYQPWWNIFAKRNRYMSAEEERLQRFWHDYYDALHRYYASLDRIDWVSYYKNHGYQINTGCGYGQMGGSQRVQF